MIPPFFVAHLDGHTTHLTLTLAQAAALVLFTLLGTLGILRGRHRPDDDAD